MKQFAIRSLALGFTLLAQLTLWAQLVPHGFSGITILPDHTVNLVLHGTVSNRFKPLFDLYVLETSLNLKDWLPLITLVRTNANTNPLRFTDSQASGSGAQFYRTPANSFITPFNKVTGPYPIGTLDRVFSDPSRTNRYGVKTNASFYATFWYPAQPTSGTVPERLVDAELGNAMAKAFNIYVSGFGVVTNFYVAAFRDCPVATNQTAYPVVLYSCGGGGYRKDNASLAQELASHGYVVVGADHADNSIVRVPGGPIVSGNLPADSVATYQSRYQDIQVVLAELAILNTSDPVLRGHLDLDHIGIFGWSTGGVNAAQLCLEEPRIKAGVLLDPGFISYAPNLLKRGISTPFLVITGELSDGKQLFDIATGIAYWLNIAGSVHRNMGDTLLYFGAAKDKRISQVLHAYTLSFLNQSLLKIDDHLLDDPSPLYPEVKKILRK